MRVVFMGSPAAAVPSLEAIAEFHEIAAVYTRPDRPRGRGRHIQPTPVKDAALARGLVVVEPKTLRDTEEQERLRGFAPDVIAVVAFGYLLPPEVLEIPRLGCVNVHFSLLPRWRGAAPVARTLMAGDEVTGVTTMLMDEGLDTGPILLVEEEPVYDADDTETLTARLAQRGARLLVATLEGLDAGTLQPRPQPVEGATEAKKISPEEEIIDLHGDAGRLVDRIRGLSPAPGARVFFRGRLLKVYRAESLPGDGAPGTIAEVDDEGPVVQTGSGRLRLLEVQPEGKRRMSGGEFVRGYRPRVGDTVELSVERT